MTPRAALKSMALAAMPVLNKLGIDAKRGYELAYWWSCKLQDGGTLRNAHYRELMTEPFGLTEEDYRGKRVLDVGCGPRGSLEWCTMAAERIGLDPLADSYRRLGTKRHHMRYFSAPAEAMPFSEADFDIVTCLNALDHVDDPRRAIAEMCRVLAPGGMLLLSVEIHPKPTIAEPHVLPWTLPTWFPLYVELRRELEKVGADQGKLFDHAAPPHSGILIARFAK